VIYLSTDNQSSIQVATVLDSGPIRKCN